MSYHRGLLRGILVLASVLAAGPVLAGQEEWPPITDEGMAMTDCPEQPGAAAVYLLREETQNINDRWYSVFYRLKILTAGGREHANVEIPIIKGLHILKDLKARVVGVDGTSKDFKGQIFNKTLMSTRGFKMTVLTFALPDVDVGSIIDYRYRIERDPEGVSISRGLENLASIRSRYEKPVEGGEATTEGILSIPAGSFDVQESLFTKKAKFSYIPLHDFGGLWFVPSFRLNWVHNLPQRARITKKDNLIELEMEDIPAFVKEEFMPPEETEQLCVRFYFCDGKIVSPEDYWNRECQNWQKGAEKFIGKSRKITAESQKLVEGMEDPMAKLTRLYERAQKVRNLSYEWSMTDKQRKSQKIKDNKNAEDVLQRDFGLRSDITRFFVALSRAAGFEAQVVRVATRDDKFFSDRLFNLYGQLDSEMAQVRVGERDVFLDPATPFCPFGLIHWSRSDTAGLRPSEAPPAFFRTPMSVPDMATTQRKFNLKFSPEGDLSGEVTVTFTGQEALTRRLRYILSDEIEIEKGLEEEFAALLPKGAKVNLLSVEKMTESSPQVLARFELSVAGFGTEAGSRVLIPISPLQGAQQHPFSHAERKYPVYFPYPFRELNEIVISLPEGMSVASTPATKAIQGTNEVFSLFCAAEGGTKLNIRRDLTVKRYIYPVKDYSLIKSFYDEVRAGDEQHIVLLRESGREAR